MCHVVVSFGLLLLLGLGYGLAGGWQSQLPPVKPAVPAPGPTLTERGQVQLPDGLSYTVVKPGMGPATDQRDKIKIHFSASLAKGKNIGSSSDSSLPPDWIQLGSSTLLPGLQRGVIGMKTGEVRRLFIPSELAYGDHPVGCDIPAGSDLVIEVELLERQESGR